MSLEFTLIKEGGYGFIVQGESYDFIYVGDSSQSFPKEGVENSVINNAVLNCQGYDINNLPGNSLIYYPFSNKAFPCNYDYQNNTLSGYDTSILSKELCDEIVREMNLNSFYKQYREESGEDYLETFNKRLEMGFSRFRK